MSTTQKPEPKALLAGVQFLDKVWDRWIEAEDGDEAFALVEEAVGRLRGVLAGTRRMRSHTDTYGFLRLRCECGWSGSPWSDGDPMAGVFATAREQATAEFARHACYPTPEPRARTQGGLTDGYPCS